MKLNIIKVLNTIAIEESTVAKLNDPDAFWNIKEDLKESYEYYKRNVEWENDNTWEMIEWLEKNGQDYSNWTKYLKKVLTFGEWLVEENKMRAKYMVAV